MWEWSTCKYNALSVFSSGKEGKKKKLSTWQDLKRTNETWLHYSVACQQNCLSFHPLLQKQLVSFQMLHGVGQDPRHNQVQVTSSPAQNLLWRIAQTRPPSVVVANWSTQIRKQRQESMVEIIIIDQSLQMEPTNMLHQLYKERN